jgi:type VI protein secretion system component Hcp
MSMMVVALVAVAAMAEGQAFARGAAVKGEHIKEGQITMRRDVSTGQTTGKRSHKPFTIKKTIDKSSPKLY